MRAMTAAFALLGLLGLCGCGEKAEPTKTPAAAPAPTAPTPPTPGTPPPAAVAASSFTGVLTAQAVTIAMVGTHQLTEGGKVVCLLGSKTVDLAAYVGKRVKVTGPASPTTENNQTIVDVQKVEVLP